MSNKVPLDSSALDALRAKWGDGWHIWRSRSHRDVAGDEPTGDYVATLTDDAYGLDRTVMCTTPADMLAALQAQRAAAQAGERPAIAGLLTA